MSSPKMLSVLAAACAEESKTEQLQTQQQQQQTQTQPIEIIPRESVNHNDVVIVCNTTTRQPGCAARLLDDAINAEDAQALGNRRFLILASLRRLAWAHARGTEEKKIVAETLVQAVLKSRPGGRFLVRRRIRSQEDPNMLVANDDYVKVDHGSALAEAVRILDRQHAETTSAPDGGDCHSRLMGTEAIIPVPPGNTPTQPTISDVLCGRGAATNNHPGNLRFRALISLHQDQYLAAQNGEKAEISRSVVRALRQFDPPGRFLKKEPSSGLWYDIGEDKATEKTSQAFREKKNNQSPNLHLLFSKLPSMNMSRAAVHPAVALQVPPMQQAVNVATRGGMYDPPMNLTTQGGGMFDPPLHPATDLVGRKRVTEVSDSDASASSSSGADNLCKRQRVGADAQATEDTTVDPSFPLPSLSIPEKSVNFTPAPDNTSTSTTNDEAIRLGTENKNACSTKPSQVDCTAV